MKGDISVALIVSWEVVGEDGSEVTLSSRG
jgi:hypothetical protein